MACPKGHLACKECFYQTILAQKKEIQRQKALLKQQEVHEQAKAMEKEQEKQQAFMAQFEQSFSGIMSGKSTENDLFKVKDGQVYRKSTLATGVTWILDTEATDRYRHRHESDSKKTVLPSFWLPSLTPGAEKDKMEGIKTETLCTATQKNHPILIKKLISIHFTESKPNSHDYICPSCMKGLTNGTKMIFSKTCGHVLCKPCGQQFVAASEQCFVCNEKCKWKDWIELETEGTGFAAGGGIVQAVKETVAFQ
jgi:nitric oxide synthase-interacting protein